MTKARVLAVDDQRYFRELIEMMVASDLEYHERQMLIAQTTSLT